MKTIMPIICVLWICFIFFLSSDETSNKKTMKISYKITSSKVINKKISVSSLNFIIRKSSHFFEYMILAIMLTYTSQLYSLKLNKSFPYVLLLCLFLANLDEFYQSFTGRTSKVSDSLIDFCGSTLGLIFYEIILLIKINS